VTGAALRPPYRAAVAVTLAVLAGYVMTLAPSVTFWDAGEFIAATRVLGIPHPPGTPLFVLIAHVWAMLVPIGEYAARTNLLSALFSAAGGTGPGVAAFRIALASDQPVLVEKPSYSNNDSDFGATDTIGYSPGS